MKAGEQAGPAPELCVCDPRSCPWPRQQQVFEQGLVRSHPCVQMLYPFKQGSLQVLQPVLGETGR